MPLLVEPELKYKAPLDPAVPPLADRILSAPLLDDVPSPVETPMNPPVCTVLRPDTIRAVPPAPLVPLPTVMNTAPERPLVAAPVPIRIWPELPLLDDPELKTNKPDAPDSPAFVLRIVTAPLEPEIPWPPARLIAPPVEVPEPPPA